MKKRTLSPLFLSLAASDATPEQLRRFASWVKQNGADSLVDSVLQIRDGTINLVDDQLATTTRITAAENELTSGRSTTAKQQYGDSAPPDQASTNGRSDQEDRKGKTSRKSVGVGAFDDSPLARVVDAPARQARDLLLNETGLSEGLAAHRLAERLKREVSVRRIKVPASAWREPSEGENFVTWLSRLGQAVPWSLILHVAARLRSEYVKEPEPIWPLREPE
jgi:hypothetical protein